MKILTLNLRHGGGPRISKILNYLEDQGADLLCLTEFRAGARGEEIILGLADLGYGHCAMPATNPKQNTVALFARSSLTLAKIAIPAVLERHVIAINVKGLLVIGVYFPQGQAKAPVFDWLLKGSPGWLRQPSIILGDFNTGLHRVDEDGATFYCADQFQALLDLGWRDAYRELHGGKKTFTWFSNKGNGFRVDHAFVAESLEVANVEYDESTRSSGITDHSSMKITLA